MKPRKYFFALALLILFHCLNTYVWLELDTRPIHIESTPQLNPAIMAYNKLVKGGWNYGEFLSIFSGYPPLYALSATLFYSLFGLNDDWAIMSNVFYIAVLIASTYGIAYHISSKKSVGLLSAIIVSCLPINVSMYRQFYVDLAVMAMVALNFYLFLRTNFFKHRLFSILYGLTGGLAALVKFTAIPYLLIPYIFGLFFKLNFVILKRQSDPKNQKDFKISNLLIAILITILIASVWYLPQFFRVFRAYYSQSNTLLKLHGFIYYLLVLVIHQLGPFFSVIFVMSLASLLIRRKTCSVWEDGFLWIWVIFPLVVFSLFVPVRNACLTVSILPAISTIIACNVLRLRIRFFKQLVVFLLILISVFYSMAYFLKFETLSLKLSNSFSRIYGAENMPVNFIPILPGAGFFDTYLRVQKKDWKISEVIDTIKKDSSEKKILPRVLINYSGDYFSGAHLLHYAELKGLPKDYIWALPNNFLSPEQPVPSLHDFNYLINVTGNASPSNSRKEEWFIKFQNKYPDFEKRLLPLAEFKLPYGLTCIIYYNNNLDRLN